MTKNFGFPTKASMKPRLDPDKLSSFIEGAKDSSIVSPPPNETPSTATTNPAPKNPTLKTLLTSNKPKTLPLKIQPDIHPAAVQAAKDAGASLHDYILLALLEKLAADGYLK